MQPKYRGAITALVTPFTKVGAVDTAALRRLVRFQLAGGIDGLVPCGSTGEAATLSEAEYEVVVRTVAREVAGRVPVVAGAGSNDTQKAIRLSQIACSAGADALLHVTPYYNKPTPSGLTAHFGAVAAAVNLPIIAYNVPGRTGQNMTSGTLLQLIAAVPQIVGIKEASGDLNQIMAIIAGTPPEFAVLSGDDALTLPIMAAGGHGAISVVANEIPEPFAALVHAALDLDLRTARRLHYQWLDLMEANFTESNPIPVKTALEMMGRIHAGLRLPLTPMQPPNRKALETLLKGHNLI